MTGRFKDICLDAADHHALADWWCSALGYVRKDSKEPADQEHPEWQRPRGWPVPIIDPTGTGPLIWVILVPEAKTVKNRMHIDILGETTELLAAGATLVRAHDVDPDPDDDDAIEHDVLADPEGNEFCVFAPR